MLNLEPQKFVTWDEPIEMLYACHSRVKQFCRQLLILPDYIAQNGVNQAVKNDVQQILNYFNQAAPLHHDDEEKDFFPALAQKLPETQQAIHELESQHEALHQNWYELREKLQDLLADKLENIEPELIKRFVFGYDLHISIEEPLFELGRVHLAESELETMGKIMAERRKI